MRGLNSIEDLGTAKSMAGRLYSPLGIFKMKTKFVHLNKDWNAQPNPPDENVEVKQDLIELSFYVNPWA